MTFEHLQYVSIHYYVQQLSLTDICCFYNIHINIKIISYRPKLRNIMILWYKFCKCIKR